MPVRPAIRPAYPREARHRHGASLRAPCLRSTVSIRCLRPAPLPSSDSGSPLLLKIPHRC